MLQSLRYAPAPQALKANSQREGTKITIQNKRLLNEALNVIHKNADPNATIIPPPKIFGKKQSLSELLTTLQGITDPLKLVITEVNGGYIASLVNPKKDRYGTGLVTSKILFPPSEGTSSLEHASNTFVGLIMTANNHAVHSREPNQFFINQIDEALGISTT
jgi:hypothetical protein